MNNHFSHMKIICTEEVLTPWINHKCTCTLIRFTKFHSKEKCKVLLPCTYGFKQLRNVKTSHIVRKYYATKNNHNYLLIIVWNTLDMHFLNRSLCICILYNHLIARIYITVLLILANVYNEKIISNVLNWRDIHFYW